jgi:hypothetical protein
MELETVINSFEKMGRLARGELFREERGDVDFSVWNVVEF